MVLAAQQLSPLNAAAAAFSRFSRLIQAGGRRKQRARRPVKGHLLATVRAPRVTRGPGTARCRVCAYTGPHSGSRRALPRPNRREKGAEGGRNRANRQPARRRRFRHGARRHTRSEHARSRATCMPCGLRAARCPCAALWARAPRRAAAGAPIRAPQNPPPAAATVGPVSRRIFVPAASHSRRSWLARCPGMCRGRPRAGRPPAAAARPRSPRRGPPKNAAVGPFPVSTRCSRQRCRARGSCSPLLNPNDMQARSTAGGPVRAPIPAERHRRAPAPSAPTAPAVGADPAGGTRDSGMSVRCGLIYAVLRGLYVVVGTRGGRWGIPGGSACPGGPCWGRCGRAGKRDGEVKNEGGRPLRGGPTSFFSHLRVPTMRLRQAPGVRVKGGSQSCVGLDVWCDW